MSAYHVADLPSISSMLHPPRVDFRAGWGDIQYAEQVNIKFEDDMNIDVYGPIPNTVESVDAISNSASLSIKSESSTASTAKPLRNFPIHGLPHLALSSSDAYLISIPAPGKSVVSTSYCDIYQGIYAPARLKLAMKCPRIFDEGTTQAEVVERRYKREAKIWLSLNHVNVLPFYGVIERFSITYLVSPWVALGDLSKFVADRLKYFEHQPLIQDSVSDQKRAAFLAFDEAAIVHGIASGLAYLHACGVIHGDIKAANILLADSLTPLLGDFGLTKDDEFNVTSPGSKGSGTSRWKSPGLNNDLPRTPKTDIFALGMTIVEILTGREPFPDMRSNLKVYLAVVQGRRPSFEPLSRKGKDLRPLWELAASCWQEKPEDRPTAAQVVGRTLPLLPTTFPRPIPEIQSCISSDGALINSPASGSQYQPTSYGYDGPATFVSNDTYGVAVEEGEAGVGFSGASELLRIGTMHRKEGRYQLALPVLQAACQQYRRLDSPRGIAQCLRCSGEVLHELGHNEEAASSLSEAFQLYQELGELFSMAECVQITGDVLWALGCIEDAMSKYTQGCELFKQLDGRSNVLYERQPISLLSNGTHSRTKGELEEFTTTAAEFNSVGKKKGQSPSSLDLLAGQHVANELRSDENTSTNDCGHSMEVGKLFSVGEPGDDQEHYENTCACLSNALYKELGDQSMMARCLLYAGEAEEGQGHYENAFTLRREAYTIYKELGDRNMMALCLKSIGVAKANLNHYDDACTALTEAATIYMELGDRNMMALCLKCIGDTMETYGRYNDAIKPLSEAYAIYVELGDRDMIARCLKSIGVTKANQGHYDNAFTLLSEAWVIVKEFDDPRARCAAVEAVGVLLDVWRRLDDPTLEVTETYEPLDEARKMVYSLHCAGKVRCEWGLYEEAMELYGGVHQLLKGLGSRWDSAKCLRSLAVGLQKQGDQLRHIECLIRLAGALGPIDVPEPGGSEPIEEGYMVVLSAGQLLEGLGDHVRAPEWLKIEMARLYVDVAIAFSVRLKHEEARSTLLEAGRFLQQSTEMLQVMDNLSRLEDVLQKAGCSREALAVSQERASVQLESRGEMPMIDLFHTEPRRVYL
ncbi:hypothetical protein FRB93_006245 [Tulasnella sp. JGI-2019a]|nr:hypothetical protein FRB93_006245 [Tulasnella sp. JGI-2019a]